MAPHLFTVIHAPNSRIRLIIPFALAAVAAITATARSGRKVFLPGQRAVVFD